MRLDLYSPKWFTGDADVDVESLNSFLNGVWVEAAKEFAAERSAKLSAGKNTPKGVQPFLNRVLSSRLSSAGWEGNGGRFLREGVWLRITFRHQMSLGADVLDALKVVRKGLARVAIIAAATSDFLEVISPNDAAVLTSFEKVSLELSDLEGVLLDSILVGSLSRASDLPPATRAIVQGPRPRNK